MEHSKKKGVLRYQKHLFAVGLFSLALSEILILRDPHFWFDGLPGFYAVFGLVSCLLLIVMCKALGQHWLMVKENYYDVNETAQRGNGHLD